MPNRFAVIPATTFDQNLEPAAILLLTAISVHLDKQGNLNAGYSVLCQMLGRSKGWVSKNMKILVNKELIKQEGKVFSIVNDVQCGEHAITNSNNYNTSNSNIYISKTTRIPENFHPEPNGIAYARTKTSFTEDQISAEIEKFKNHAAAKDRKLANWDAGWRQWIIAAQGYSYGREATPKRQSPTEKFDELTSAAQAAELLFGTGK